MSFFMKAKGLIAAILTIFLLPFAKVAPAPRTPASQPTVQAGEATQQQEDNGYKEDSIEPTTNGATNETEQNATEELAQDNATAEPEAETNQQDEYEKDAELAEATAEQYAPVAEWDVSDTDEDDVKMYYYEENDEDFIDVIAGAVRNVFVPMTAFAAEGEEEEQYTEGTVVIDGEGATEEMLYLNWLNTDGFVSAYDDWCVQNGYGNTYIRRDHVAQDGRFLTQGVTAQAAREALGEDATNIDLLQAYIPMYVSDFMDAHQDFWSNSEYVTFAPTKVIIKGTVDEINFGAFALCTTINEIVIEEGVVAIHGCAFTRTGITQITLPTTIEVLGDSAFESCNNLMTVNILNDIDSYGDNVFFNLPQGSVINCETEAAFLTVAASNTASGTSAAAYGTARTTMVTKTTVAVYDDM